ncbi:glycosyl hydrolases family 31-domain-containing protein [Lineolata rhizophorae]|uniref:Glycosyl hydrolases family 31-domain-containing protein n=1 Tax=Lineolata rhizophorae TaxID=578093 RepID=A0A6A6NX52_9PEZI|nr:glycosyl hydrolases family 31-domain-containing protein [Lineolata rhizophorae]
MTQLVLLLAAFATSCVAQYSLSVTGTSPYSLAVQLENQTLVANNAVLTGAANSSTAAISASISGQFTNSSGEISAAMLSSTIAKIDVNTANSFVGAQFSTSVDEDIFGVWEYPWSLALSNNNVSFDLKGVANNEGMNWVNARAPFFMSSKGYGVYTDTLAMGSYDFTDPSQARFIFNSSSLTYYIIMPILEEASPFKSIIEQYTNLSARITMPPDSGYGPTFWSDDAEQDFHGSVSNAEENFYDILNHLYYNQIHATSMFADRPYGTGNHSFGNFDFDPEFYPDPDAFIANLSSWGFDFQVWVANRAFLYTELFNTSDANEWLFTNQDPTIFLGPALNLSIPEAYDYFKDRLSYFTDLGVKGYKIDRGEEDEMPVYEQNVQMALFEQLCAENMEAKWGPNGYYNFARSVVDRSRARAAVWNGDSWANFTGLAYTVASGIRSGLMGFSQWGSDTGGYVREEGNPTEELWARWMHFSTFSPMYELMLGTNHTPWYDYSPRLVSILKQTANLHHDLVPFIKSHTYTATQTGIPLMRALFLEAPLDDAGFSIADEYFFGSEFLVAPFVSSGTQRSVYFPKGGKYLEYFNKTEVYEGGTSADIRLDLEDIPVYVREGAIVPRGDVVQGNNKWTDDWAPSLTIEIFPSYDMPKQEFRYYWGTPGEGHEATITTTMDPDYMTVLVSYGEVGANGTIVVYTKSGPIEAEIVPEGAESIFFNVESLFACEEN